jgi:transcriptional regulator with XRE-family HTH domain
MITRIREVRKARNMTLEEVAAACLPPTTPQTIGRLETGTRTVSVGWLNRIAAALDVETADLVDHPARDDLPVLAALGASGAVAPQRSGQLVPPRVKPGQVGIRVDASLGDYRSGDEIWCDRLEPQDFGRALNRDVLVPRPAGRFLFGRLIGRDGNRLQVLPPGSGSRQTVVTDAPWLALASQLIRRL